jgi:formylglycine-generating enzyme required for sulfatase activity
LMRGVGRKKTEPSAPLPPPAPSKPVVPAEQTPVATAEVKPAAKPDPVPVAAASSLVLPNELTNSVGMKFRLIQPGTFMMGSPESELGRGRDERQHQVTLTNLYSMGIYPVTQSEYHQIMGSNPSRFKGDCHPVEQVSWEDATEFIKKLNGLSEERTAGRFYRLPTESEWEYACRAGSSTAYCFGEDEARLGEYAWYGANSGSKTHPVGQKAPNAWGLYDMHGNVWEWCSDWYGDYPSGSVRDPKGPSTGSYRVSRGGSWSLGAAHCRSANRCWIGPSLRYSDLGFRLALSSLGTSPAAERGR